MSEQPHIRVHWMDDGVAMIDCLCGNTEMMVHVEPYADERCYSCGRRYRLVQYVELQEGPEPNAMQIYVPTAFALGEAGPLDSILPHSAIVGHVVGQNEEVLIDFEGRHYDHSNMVTFHDRLIIAAGRHKDRAPTVARMMIDSSTLVRVGEYDYSKQEIKIDKPVILAAWLGIPNGPALDAQLRRSS